MYQNLQKCMKYANGGGGDVEYESYMYVYHGCAPNKVEAIVANGLNRSLCKSDGPIGCAVYVSPEIDLAVKHSMKAQAGDCCCVLVCNILTGKFCVGAPEMVQPPVRDPKTLERYNSTVDRLVHPQKIAVFTDYQLLLRYVITLR